MSLDSAGSSSNAAGLLRRAIGLLAFGGLLAGCQANTAPASPEAAVYAEYSDTTKPMAVNWNTRVFNRREVQEGKSINLEDKTGIVTLEPGFYHIAASSLVTYFDPKSPMTTPVNVNPPGGYARIRYSADSTSITNDKAVAISTVGNADTIPSTIDTFLRVDKESKILLEHQVGDAVKNVYLEVNTNNSAWHVFSRISIQRLAP